MANITTDPTNMTALYEMDSWVEVFTWANTESSGLFTVFLLLSVFIISYTYMSMYRPESAFIASLLSTTILGSVFYVMGFLNPTILISMVVLTGGSLVVARYRDTT